MKQDCFCETINKSFHTKGEDCIGGKQSRGGGGGITLALTASMMGEKLKPLVIGKAQNPRCFAFSLCFISKQIKQWKNGRQSMHPYENIISTQPSKQIPPVNKDRFFSSLGRSLFASFTVFDVYSVPTWRVNMCKVWRNCCGNKRYFEVSW